MIPKIPGKHKPVFKAEKTLARRIIWSKEYDACLLQLVHLNHGKNWKKIANGMQIVFGNEGLTAKKCRERWSNCTDPTVNKSCLTKAENLMLLACHHEYGGKWALIAQNLPTRNSSKMKNTFSSLIKKVCRKIALDMHKDIITPLVFVQDFYMILTINDLIDLRNNSREVNRIASEYISKHIESTNVSVEQCLVYAKKLSQALIKLYDERNKLQSLNCILDIDGIRSFINKLFKVAISHYCSNTLTSELSILEVIESALKDGSSLDSVNIPDLDDVLNKNMSVLPTNFDSERYEMPEFIEDSVLEEVLEESPAESSFSSPALREFFQSKYFLSDLSPYF